MPRYLSPEWVRAFDAALQGLDLSDAVAEAGRDSLTASSGDFAVAQEVTDLPEGVGGPDVTGTGSDAGARVRTVLTVADGRATLQADPGAELPSNVTMVLAYADALAIARGELDPADALAGGRVRVRGELAVLVAGQTVLNAAARQLGPTLDAITDGE
jgi:hypothetical protein